AADRYAIQNASDPRDLRAALLKLREKSRVLPLSHPLYSRVYHSHPPLLERLAALAEPPPVGPATVEWAEQAAGSLRTRPGPSSRRGAPRPWPPPPSHPRRRSPRPGSPSARPST